MMVRSPAISAHKRRSLSQRARRDAEAEQRDPAPAYPPHGTVVGEVVLRLTPCSARHAIVRKHCARGLLILNDDERMIAALYVEPSGVYSGLENVDPWDEARDARKYSGPHPVVAHPPCQRWGKFWHGSTRKPHQYRLGEDGGCFAAALTAVRNYGGALEHPADSKAWAFFGLKAPKRGAGWQDADAYGLRTCYVEQGHYGHASRKPTWLLANAPELPELDWSRGKQRLPDWMIERYGYAKARRIGVVAMIGGKDKTALRNGTPPPFRDLLLSIARMTHNAKLTGDQRP